MQKPQKILILRPSALGDVCRTVGVLASLRRAFPQAHLAWVVQDDFAPAIEAHPALNEIIPFPRSNFADWWKSPRAFAGATKWLAALRRRHFDLVLDCQGLARSGLMSLVSGAKQRIGLRCARECAWLGYNVKVPANRSQPLPIHTVDRMFLLIHELGVDTTPDMRLFVPPEQENWWRNEKTKLGIDGDYAVIAPTSRWLSKRWPIERFAQLISPLLYRGFSNVVVIGSPSEAEQVQGLFSGAGSNPHEQSADSRTPLINLVGQTTISQTLAVIADAKLVIANDSAPLHIAVGFDRPMVGLYGPTDPAVVGPYQKEDSVVRGYQPRAGETINYKDAKLGDSVMRYISHTTVLQAIDRVMRRPANHLKNAAAVAEAAS